MKQENRRQVIVNFLEHEGPLTVRALSAKCGIDQTTLSRDLDWLVNAEIVSKTENEGWRSQRVKVARFTYRLESMA